ncbi:MAG: hypothetical protein ACE5HP_06555 [Gemmatimonadota bacterium]
MRKEKGKRVRGGGQPRPETADELEELLQRTELEPTSRGETEDHAGPVRRLFRWFTPAKVALTQGAYYVATGLWPFFGMATFLQVTGPKTDLWLVRTVGGLLAIIGLSLGISALRRRVTPGLRLLGLGVALFLAASDVWYVATTQVWPIFLGDAAVELLLVAAWITAREPKS